MWLLRTFEEEFVVLKEYASLVRPHLEYCTQIWTSLSIHGNWSSILGIESIQRLATRCIRGFTDLSYSARLNRLNLTALLERRMRGDLSKTFKIVNGFTEYDREWFTLSPRTDHFILGQNLSSVSFFANRVRVARFSQAIYTKKYPKYIPNLTKHYILYVQNSNQF